MRNGVCNLTFVKWLFWLWRRAQYGTHTTHKKTSSQCQRGGHHHKQYRATCVHFSPQNPIVWSTKIHAHKSAAAHASLNIQIRWNILFDICARYSSATIWPGARGFAYNREGKSEKQKRTCGRDRHRTYKLTWYWKTTDSPNSHTISKQMTNSSAKMFKFKLSKRKRW